MFCKHSLTMLWDYLNCLKSYCAVRMILEDSIKIIQQCIIRILLATYFGNIVSKSVKTYPTNAVIKTLKMFPKDGYKILPTNIL